MTKSSNALNLEETLSEVAKLIEKMEHGELNLDESLVQFERGIKLIKHAQKTLQDAEQKVQILLQKNNQEGLENYENPQE